MPVPRFVVTVYELPMSAVGSLWRPGGGLSDERWHSVAVGQASTFAAPGGPARVRACRL
jgi:hypothetical protein